MSWTRSAGLAVAVAVTVLLASVIEGEAARRSKKAPKGKEIYKANCKVCHVKDSKNGEYTPMSLTAEQWTRFFDKKYDGDHKGLSYPKQKDGAAGKKLDEVLTPEVLKQLKKFCEEHAADSERPMTCG